MRWRLVIELTRAMAPSTTHEVATRNDDRAGSVVSALGLTLADAKALLAGVLRHLVQAQVRIIAGTGAACPHCREHAR